MSLGLSASVLVVPLLLNQGSPSNTVLSGMINSKNSDLLTAYQVNGATATVAIQMAASDAAMQTGSMGTVVNTIPSVLHPVASTLVYDAISSVVPADQVVLAQTAKPDTLVAPAHAVLPPPPPPPPVERQVPVRESPKPAPAATFTSSRIGPGSWYAAPFGTCANTWLPFGTVVHITNLATGRTTTCRVEDRGPYIGGRILDMSEGTFAQLAPIGEGVINIKMEW